MQKVRIKVMIYKIRVILNAEEDVIRDVAIDEKSTLEDLHNTITNAFGFTGNEMASFYRSDETWMQGEEHPLFDMSEGLDKKVQMDNMNLDQVLIHSGDKMIYVYDFLNMWSFYVELIANDFEHNNTELPALLFSLGLIPNNAPEIQFESEDLGDDDLGNEDFEGEDLGYDDFDGDMFKEIDGDFEDLNLN